MAVVSYEPDIRILAVDPTSKGIGFAVLEGRNGLIDWGVRSARGEKNPACLRHVADLLDLFRPDVLVIEDHRPRSARRKRRVQVLLNAIARLGQGRGTPVRRLSRHAVRRAFQHLGAATKYQIATVIASQYKGLGLHLPRRRKPWMSEDERMGAFSAVSFAVAHLGSPRDDTRSGGTFPGLS